MGTTITAHLFILRSINERQTQEVYIHPVKARSYDEALIKAGEGRMEKIVRRVKLEETRSNDVYMNPDMDTTTLFARQIDHFELDIKDYDYPIPSK